MDPQQVQQHMAHVFATLFPLFGIIILIGAALYIIPLWRICTKAGLAGPLALLALIPLGKLIVLYIVAFSDWKVIPAAYFYPSSQPYPPPPPNYPPPPPPAGYNPPPPPQP
jgi:hypothetical protein